MTIDESLRRDLLTLSTGTPPKNKVEKTSPLDLDQLIISSSKQVLLKKIDFQPAEQEVSFCLKNLRGKYVPVNSSKERQNPGMVPMSNQGSTSNLENGKQDGIPKPKLVLFNPEKIHLDWQKCHRIGAGLINMGNTCFLNSTLQCLSYTPPLANYLLSHQHKEQCQMSGFCMMCELYNHLVRIGQHHGQAVRPMVIIHKLKQIAKHMHLGRQEDAHEFLRYVIEAMQRSSMCGYDKLDKFSKETSIVHQIFGGYYRSRVTCSLCQAISDTFDPFLDIGLDIKHVPSVNKALDRLIRAEVLDGDNKYKCARCKRQVTAQKKFTIHRSSNVLTLCLKKFDFQRFGSGKLHKDISYPEVLNIRPYMSDVKGPSIMYNLYAVLTHQGASCNSGHYFCFVRAPNKMWYCMNDAHVSQASLNRVMNQDAYLLFYIRKPQGSTSGHKNGPKQTPKSRISGPFTQTPSKSANLSNNNSGGFISKNSDAQKPNSGGFISKNSDAQKPLVTTPKSSPRPQPSFKPTPKLATPSSSVSQSQKENPSRHQTTPFKSNTFQAPSQATALPAKREKLSFSFKNQGIAATLQTLKKEQRMKTELNQDSKQSVGDKGKRIGQKQKIESLIKPKTNSVTNWGDASQGGLVPYAADDSSESDSDENYDDVAKRLSQQAPRTSGSGQPSTSTGSSTSAATADTKATEDANTASLADSTDLTAIQSHDSPLKLTITTNGNAQRIKSTSTWHVNHSDTLISPSINSESSTGSVSSNSTQEWNITDRQKDSSRKSRKENGSGKPSHKHTVFPVIGKNGKTDTDKAGKGEMKSPVMRQLSFGKDSTNGKDRTGSTIEPPVRDHVRDGPDTEGQSKTGADPSTVKIQNEQISVNRNVKQEATKSLDSNETVPCPAKILSDSVKDGSSQTVEETGPTIPDLSCKSMASGKPSEDVGNVDKKSDKRDEHKKSTINDRVMTPTKFSSEATTPPEKSLLSGIKDHLTNKIAKHRKKRRRDSESDEEKLLSEDSDGKKKPKSDDYEWYVVPGDEEALKKKKKKRKRRQREDKEGKVDEDSKRVDKEEKFDDDSKRVDKEGKCYEDNRKFGKEGKFDEDIRRVGDSTPDERESWERGNAMGNYREKKIIDSDSERESTTSQKKYNKNDSFKPNGRSSDSDESTAHPMDTNRYNNHSSGTESLHKDHKAKKRKRKDRGGDRQRLLEDSEDEEEERYSAQGKRKYFPNGEKESGKDRHRSGESKQHHKYRKDVHEQSWDHHIRDGHRKPHHDKSSLKGSSSWDGRLTGSDDVVHHLTKSSFGGYGSLVQSWDGGKSQVDEEAQRDSKQAKRRDYYNEEFDEGKVKKIKKRTEEYDDWNGRGYHRNPFQNFQSSKNKGRMPPWNNRRSSGGGSYQRFDHQRSHSWQGSNWR